MSDVKVFLKESEYTDGQGNKRVANNFYLKVGRTLIPISVKYFPSKDGDGKDKLYPSRMQILANFAEDLPADAFGKSNRIKTENDIENLPDAPGNIPF